MTVTISVTSVTSFPQYLQEMKSKQARVIIVDVYDHVARDIMCEAYRLEMTARQGYVWFLPLWLNQDWYDPKSRDFPCTKEQMKDVSMSRHPLSRRHEKRLLIRARFRSQAIDGHLSLSHAYFARDSEVMQEGLTVGQWRRKYDQRCRNTSVETSNYAGYAYDAVWTYALALDRLARENQSYLYELHSEATTRRFVQIISATDFAGVSGRIQFLGGGPSRITVVNVVQWLNGTARNVGYFEPNVSSAKVDIVGGRSVFFSSAALRLSALYTPPSDSQAASQRVADRVAVARRSQAGGRVGASDALLHGGAVTAAGRLLRGRHRHRARHRLQLPRAAPHHRLHRRQAQVSIRPRRGRAATWSR